MSHYRVRFVRVSLYIGSVGHLTAGAPTCIVVVMYSVQYVWGATVILNLQSFSPTYCNRRGGGGRDGETNRYTELILTVSREIWLTICQDSNPSGPVIDLMKCIRTYGFDLPQKFANTKKNSAVSLRPQIWTPRCQWYQNPWHQGQRRVKTIYVKFQWFFALLWRGSFTKSWLCFFMIKIQLKRLKLLIIFLGDFLYLKNKSCWLRGVIDTELFFIMTSGSF